MRKVFFLVLFVIGFGFYFQVSARAEVSIQEQEEVIAIIDKANEKIDEEIEKAIIREENLQRDENYEEKLDALIENLLRKTYHISESTIVKVESKYEVDLECVYIAVTIGERVVYIDPIRVHCW